MEKFPLVATPDVFGLAIGSEAPGFSRALFETQWGTTDEELCFFNGTLLGKVARNAKAEGLYVVLVPRLDRQRPYPWPLASEFAKALHASRDCARSWDLRCEHDADQNPVVEISDQMAARDQIDKVLAYCNGHSDFCPSFSIKSPF